MYTSVIISCLVHHKCPPQLIYDCMFLIFMLQIHYSLRKNENEVTVTTQHLLCTALTNLILKPVASKSKKEKMCVSFWLYVCN